MSKCPSCKCGAERKEYPAVKENKDFGSCAVKSDNGETAKAVEEYKSFWKRGLDRLIGIIAK